jgi:hypothetical protein
MIISKGESVVKRTLKRSWRISRSAISPVISTVILSTTLLIVMIVTTGVANDLLRNQMASTEFESAKNLIKSIATEVDSIIYHSEASAVIKASFLYTSPSYTKTGKIMNVSFTNYAQTFNIHENTMNLETIPGVNGQINYILQGSSSSFVPNYLSSFGRIYISKPFNWRVSLDYNRAQYAYSGVSNLFDGSHTTPYNIVEITVVEMGFTQFDTSDNAIIILKNEGINTSTFTLTGNWKMTVTTRDSGSKQISLTEMGGNAAYPTQIQFNKINLNIHVMGAS